jgi:magnesium chelatase family protein
MAFAVTYSRAQIGIEAPLVTVEADISQGLPQIQIVGLPATTVKEAKDRVKSAIANVGLKTPNRRVTVNLAPADLPKQGGRYDLAIALSILAANGNLPITALQQCEWLGELALDGQLRPVKGVLPAAIQCAAANRLLVVPRLNGAEATLASTSNVMIADNLQDVIAHLNGLARLSRPEPMVAPIKTGPTVKISEVRGQHIAKHALIIAAAGGHNLLFTGPPGSGKTMLASRLSSLLPPLSTQEALEVAAVHSVSNNPFSFSMWGQRPFRSPHHTTSSIALVGGSSPPRPGEISLAHNGVLFLDELPEYSRRVLEVLREPLESGLIMISRAQYQVCYPARFQLVAAMNPCPCGYYGDGRDRCNCSINRIQAYRSRVSGPLMDRIDLHVEVPALAQGILSDAGKNTDDNSHEAAMRLVSESRAIMYARAGKLNAHLTSHEVARDCRLSADDSRLLDTAMDKLGLSARGYYKILKVARTIADLAKEPDLLPAHLVEALAFRRLDSYDAN